MFRSAAAAFAAALALSAVMAAGGAGAQEVIPTAKGVTPPDVSQDPLPAQIQPPEATNLAPVLPGPCGTGPVPRVAPVNADGGPQVDHSPHGEVSVGADSRGGRYAEGSVCVPIGDRSSVSIDVGEGRSGNYWRR
jgi:hypothetical protein